MSYRCLVADDNLIDRDLIIKYLSKIDNIQVVAACTDGREAANILAHESVDILFSDIDMPYLSGMGLVKSLKQSPVVVFITSHVEYAIEGFNLDVVDFVVKPLTFDRFYKSVNKAVEYLSFKKTFNDKNDIGNEGVHDINENIGAEHFFIKETNGITRIHYSEVLYIESMGDYSKIFTSGGKHITLVSLKNMEKQLPGHLFKRIHKQYMVNLDHIVTITSSEVLLSDKQSIPISAVARQEVIDRLVNNRVLSRTAE
jgi:two-component system LytT family response regulator